MISLWPPKSFVPMQKKSDLNIGKSVVGVAGSLRAVQAGNDGSGG